MAFISDSVSGDLNGDRAVWGPSRKGALAEIVASLRVDECSGERGQS